MSWRASTGTKERLPGVKNTPSRKENEHHKAKGTINKSIDKTTSRFKLRGSERILLTIMVLSHYLADFAKHRITFMWSSSVESAA